ncbi:poly(3-hydroxybutyrate) depolymerase [Neptunomonas sp.]|uniref:extracellular catalytic domain type 2 short-chain-length polyhydroxyalkanoate depolymerase n=1 Tax=Neptunomonas sp. TaxID=1971898 RepID=UPI0025FEA927|nr:poly(3-hydroxybutyrate) depolymerase [Neptunomonas sp.]
MLRRISLIFSGLFILLTTNTHAIEAPLPTMNALAEQTSVSGLSSGAYMAAQFHVAYSEKLVGAGIVAGGPWNCASTFSFMSPLSNALTTCMDPCKYTWFICPSAFFPVGKELASVAKQSGEAELIDTPDNLLDDQVYIFSGQSDRTVVTKVVDSTSDFYESIGLNGNQIFYNKSVNAGHAFITNDAEDAACDVTQSPYINNCNIPQAERMLEHIYGELNEAVTNPQGELLRFNQRSFFESELASMDDDAYVYIPQSCKTQQCRVHVALHGCRQGISIMNTTYIEQTGYMEVADSNNIIVLYPQVKRSNINPVNPRGCWDFWGYTSNNLPPFNYAYKSAPQMQAINRMIERLISPLRSAQ